MEYLGHAHEAALSSTGGLAAAARIQQVLRSTEPTLAGTEDVDEQR